MAMKDKHLDWFTFRELARMTLSSSSCFVRKTDADVVISALRQEVERLEGKCKTLKEERDRAIDRLAASF